MTQKQRRPNKAKKSTRGKHKHRPGINMLDKKKIIETLRSVDAATQGKHLAWTQNGTRGAMECGECYKLGLLTMLPVKSVIGQYWGVSPLGEEILRREDMQRDTLV